MNDSKNRRSFLKLGATVGTGLVLGGINTTSNGQGQGSDSTVFDVSKKRRSVRKFKSTPVPDEHITKILEVAASAPTPHNRQDWKFIVVKDRAKIDELKDECIKIAGDSAKQYVTDYLSAPVYIVVLAGARTRSPENELLSGAVAAGYLFLAAQALGYGTVFCRNSVPEQIARKVFNISEDYQWVCVTPVGVPAEWPETPPKKSLDELVVRETL